jgi:hypothetical protein
MLLLFLANGCNKDYHNTHSNYLLQINKLHMYLFQEEMPQTDQKINLHASPIMIKIINFKDMVEKNKMLLFLTETTKKKTTKC